jgi:hypothetical protein
MGTMTHSTHGPIARLQGAALIAAPVLLATSTVAYGATGGMGHSQIGGAIQVYAMVAFPLGLLGLVRRLEEAHPRLAALLSALVVCGAAGGVAFGVDAVHGAVHSDAPLRNLAIAPLFLHLPGLTFPLSLIGVGLALARSGAAPRWSGYALALGGALFPLSRIPAIVGLALVSDLSVAAALVPLGWGLLRSRSEEAAAARATAAVAG